MEPVQLRKLLKKYLLRQASGEEKKQVNQWYEALGESESPMYLSPTQREEMNRKLWAGVRARTAEAGQPVPEQFSPPKPRKQWQWLETAYWVVTVTGVIAVIGLLLWSFSIEPVRAPVVRAAFGEQINNAQTPMKVTLEDNSLVWLQPGSSLRYPRPFASGQREVMLQGEASFVVKPDGKRPFRVYSGQLVVRTSASGFTVKVNQLAQKIEVAVQTGQAAVYSQPAFRLQSSGPEDENKSTHQAERSAVLLNPAEKVTFYPATTQMIKARADIREKN